MKVSTLSYLSLESRLSRSVLLKLSQQLRGHDLDLVVVAHGGGVHLPVGQEGCRGPVVAAGLGRLVLLRQWDMESRAAPSSSDRVCPPGHSRLPPGSSSSSCPNRPTPSLSCPAHDATITIQLATSAVAPSLRHQAPTLGLRFLEMAML